MILMASIDFDQIDWHLSYNLSSHNRKLPLTTQTWPCLSSAFGRLSVCVVMPILSPPCPLAKTSPRTGCTTRPGWWGSNDLFLIHWDRDSQFTHWCLPLSIAMGRRSLVTFSSYQATFLRKLTVSSVMAEGSYPRCIARIDGASQGSALGA
jgi:hypothetical protein